MRGLRVYSVASGFKVVRVHYTADPEKDPSNPPGREWLKREVQGYPGGKQSSQWRQEMEIDWDAAGGELVFPQFDPNRELIVARPFEIPQSWKLYAGFDYGHRNPSAFEVLAIDHDSDVWSVWEFYGAGMGYRDVAREIRRCPYFERLEMAPIADPSIWNLTQETENEMKSVAQLYAELGENEQVFFVPGKKGGDITIAEKINGLLWKDLGKEKPRYRIFMTCPKLIWEIERLRYAEWSSIQMLSRNVKEKIVDKDNHAFDAVKVFFQMFFQGPEALQEDRLDRLKEVDYASYQEWKKVRERFNDKPDRAGLFG